MSCKIVVKPHSERHASGKPYKIKGHSYPTSQRGWRDAVRHAQNGAFRGESSTVFLACSKGDLRLIACVGHGERSTYSNVCRVDHELGGQSTRVLAGARRQKRRR